MARLGEEGNNSSARVAANDGDVFVRRVGVFNFGYEARSTDDVKGRYTEEALGVVYTFGFVDFCGNGYCRVDLGSSQSSPWRAQSSTVVQGWR